MIAQTVNGIIILILVHEGAAYVRLFFLFLSFFLSFFYSYRTASNHTASISRCLPLQPRCVTDPTLFVALLSV